MRRTVGTLTWPLAALLASLLAGGGAAARAPRHPDFTGLWSSSSLTELERPDDFKTLTVTEAEAAAFEKAHRGKPPAIGDPNNSVGGPDTDWWERDVGLARIGGQIRTSWIVSPADGARPFTPAAKAAQKARRMRQRIELDGPESRDLDERCASLNAAGPPLDNGGVNDNFQFVQTRDHLAIYAEWMHVVRIVRLADATHPAPAVRLPMGDSIGHWQGAALVVETTNFRPRDVYGDAVPPQVDPAADMRIVERFTRLSAGEILYAFEVTNPAQDTQTWRAEMLLHATRGPIYEYACHEGNYALANMLTGARRLEGKTVQGPGR